MISRIPSRARQGLVMLHGRGGTAADILSLLDHVAVPEVAGIAPEAPDHSWWPTSFLAPTAQMERFVLPALAAVKEGISALQAAGIPREAIWLCGFSQGACLALEAFARDGEGLAGVFGFSGGLIGTADAGPGQPDLLGHPEKAFNYPQQSSKVAGRAWISVHERDPHIPLRRASETAKALQSLGAEVSFEVFPGGGHGVMRQDIAALRAALNR